MAHGLWRMAYGAWGRLTAFAQCDDAQCDDAQFPIPNSHVLN
jgi:hypothetical protein